MHRFARIVCSLLVLVLTACSVIHPKAAIPAQKTNLTFTYWGSDMEKIAVEEMVTAFENANSDIHVQIIQYPYEEYLTRLSALLAEGKIPDVGFMPELQVAQWAEEGRLVDLSQLVNADPLLSSALPETRYYYAPDKIAGLNTAVDTTLLFYNKTLFDQAGLPYPPADPTQAWSWDQFVQIARQLTLDINGKHPGETGFDPDHIRQYGAAFDKIYEGWTFYPFIFSNGGQVANDDGTQLLLDSPESVQAMQDLADLMWVDHVAPTPQQDQNLPDYVTLLETGNLAMHIAGQQNLFEYASVQDLKYGVAVLPSLKTPKTVIFGSPTVIFAGSKNREAAIRFFKFHNNPETVNLFARGLWMPLQLVYYSDPTKMKFWLDNPAHPVEEQAAFTDYVINYAVPLPSYYLRNYAAVLDQAIRPAIDQIWNNELPAAEALRQAVELAKPLMAGRWDR